MPSRLDARLRRLEAQGQADEGDPHGQGLSSVLRSIDHDQADTVPLASCTDAELDAKIAALTGARGFSLLLRESLEAEKERRRRQAAL